MAKNWLVGEGARAIKSDNAADKLDIGRRFPLFAILVAQTNDAGMALLDAVPAYVTARKIEAVLKGDAGEAAGEAGDEGEDSEDAEAEVEEEKPAKKEKAPAAAKEEDPYAGKTAKELYTICKEKKIAVEPKQSVEVYLKAIKKADAAAKAKAPAKKAESDKKPAAKDDEWEI